jgi:hypothetical protein
MVDLDEFESHLLALFAEAGCSKYTVSDLHRDTKQCRDDIHADCVAHGGSIGGAFFNFIIAPNGVAIFTFFEVDFSVYVFACNEYEVINETSVLAMADTGECRRLLVEKFGKKSPDLVIAWSLADYWLSK